MNHHWNAQNIYGMLFGRAFEGSLDISAYLFLFMYLLYSYYLFNISIIIILCFSFFVGGGGNLLDICGKTNVTPITHLEIHKNMYRFVEVPTFHVSVARRRKPRRFYDVVQSDDFECVLGLGILP